MKPRYTIWARLAALAVLTVYFYTFMEWLFTVTKPSFMSLMTVWNRLAVLLLPSLLAAGAGLLALLLLFSLNGLALRLNRHWEGWFLGLGSLVPAGVLAAAGLMLVDNFTYTVFKVGVVSTHGYQRGLYGTFFLLLLVGAGLWVRRRLRLWAAGPREGWLPAVAGALLALSIPLGGSLFFVAQTGGAADLQVTPAARPNILLIGSDGLDADATSIYGAQPDTTPFLRQFAQQSLLAENNFPNANITAGSLASIFTSKLPTQTRMMYPPDILSGADALEHLPGLLKNAGYYNAEISVDYYADPSVLNLQNSFVMVNGRSATVGRLYTLSREFLPEDAAYFLASTAKRLAERVLHIFYVQAMTNPYAEVNQKLNSMSDQDRMGRVISLFRDIQQPLFIHVHMMGTHTNDDAVYAQGVVDFDNNMRALMTELDQMGKLDNTIVIVYTDHGYGDVSNQRIPLMFHFPGGAHAGKITANTQNLDIAPTILDALGAQPPAWMSGVSLLKGEPPADRPIFSAAPGFRTDASDRLQIDLSKVKPPFYQFGSIGMIVCQNWYALDTATLTWSEGVVKGAAASGAGATAACAAPDDSLAQETMLSQLETDGFNVAAARRALVKK